MELTDEQIRGRRVRVESADHCQDLHFGDTQSMGHPASAAALDLVVTHLNAPVGSVLTSSDLRSALLAGSLAPIHRREASALVTYMFVELEPQLIIRCVNELRSELLKANALYEETLKAKAPRVPSWEEAIRHLL